MPPVKKVQRVLSKQDTFENLLEIILNYIQYNFVYDLNNKIYDNENSYYTKREFFHSVLSNHRNYKFMKPEFKLEYLKMLENVSFAPFPEFSKSAHCFLC